MGVDTVGAVGSAGMVDAVDAVVIGAGVVGLACARALAMTGREVVIVEALDAYGTQTSARNSEVLHAGLYYPASWLKTRLCVSGRPQLEAFCESHGVAWQRLGKLVVAGDAAEVGRLEALHGNARANGVAGLLWLSGDEARALEPALAPSVRAALHSLNTGIVDSHGVMRSLLGDAQDHGAMLALQSPVRAIRRSDDGMRLWVDVASSPPMRLQARTVVNAAGHGAPRLAGTVDGIDRTRVPQARCCKGNYFALSGRTPFSRLIYPVAGSHALGVHLTLDLGGQARFGPDAQWLDEDENSRGDIAGSNADMTRIDVSVDPTRAAAFATAVRRFWPGLPDSALYPAFAGLRPKIHAADEPLADFVIQGPDAHGVPGLVNLFGIESPGLTSCLAIADEVLASLAPG